MLDSCSNKRTEKQAKACEDKPHHAQLPHLNCDYRTPRGVPGPRGSSILEKGYDSTWSTDVDYSFRVCICLYPSRSRRSRQPSQVLVGTLRPATIRSTMSWFCSVAAARPASRMTCSDSTCRRRPGSRYLSSVPGRLSATLTMPCTTRLPIAWWCGRGAMFPTVARSCSRMFGLYTSQPCSDHSCTPQGILRIVATGRLPCTIPSPTLSSTSPVSPQLEDSTTLGPSI